MRKRLSIIGVLFISLFLIAIYIVVAISLDNFQQNDLFYFKSWHRYLISINSFEIQSQFWKIFLLFPAVILLAIVITRIKIKINLPINLNHRNVLIVCFLLSVFILFLSIQYVFRGTEMTDDENAYDFQAKTILAGRVVNPSPPQNVNINYWFIINDGLKWVGKYNLGHPAVLALGMLIGNRYFVTVLMSASLLLLVYFIGKEIYNNINLALLSTILLFISPFYYAVSSSLLSHTSSAFFLAVMIYTFIRARKERRYVVRVILLFITGFALGYAFNVRQLTALAFSIPLIILFLFDVQRNKMNIISEGIILVVGFMIPFSLTLWYNSIVTGSPFTFPFSYYSSSEYIGFGAYGHNLFGALRNIAITLFRLNIWFLGFPIGLIFVSIIVLVKKEFGDKFLLGFIACMFISYLFYYSPGVADLGPIYYFEILIPLSLLSARGIFYLSKNLPIPFNEARKIIAFVLILGFIASVSTFYIERIQHISRLADEIGAPYKKIYEENLHNAVVFIQGLRPRGWVVGLRNPSPTFNDDIIFCHYKDSISNSYTLKYFNERTPFILKYNASEKNFIINKIKLSPDEMIK